ncbi:MAG: MoxR family ATPase [Phycisphaerales bacterium]
MGTLTDEDREALEALDRLGERAQALRERIAMVVIGQDEIVDGLLVSVFAQGHALLEGVPGLAKTTLVRTVANALGLPFSRIQFTPDMMPSDILGAEVLRTDPATGERAMVFVPGPIFSNVILADEINRTPPKTQAALLEAMGEGQVSVGGSTRSLEKPFWVVATQNPIEQEGTYPLPEAQLDRFMVSLRLDYPDAQQEKRIAALTDEIAHNVGVGESVFDGRELVGLRRTIGRVPVSAPVVDEAVRLVRMTRPDDPSCPEKLRRLIAWGAGPRASQALVLGARCIACLRGDPAPTVEDVRRLAPSVLRHRIVLSYGATGEGLTPDRVVRALLG